MYYAECELYMGATAACQLILINMRNGIVCGCVLRGYIYPYSYISLYFICYLNIYKCKYLYICTVRIHLHFTVCRTEFIFFFLPIQVHDGLKNVRYLLKFIK